MNKISTPGLFTEKRSMPKLFIGLIIVGILSLTMHTFMIQVLFVGYPFDFPQGGFLVLLNNFTMLSGSIWFVSQASPYLKRHSFVVRSLLVVVLIAMLKEALLRRFLMNGWTTTAWQYSAVQSFPKFFSAFILGISAVTITYFIKKQAGLQIAGFGATLLLTYLLQPAVDDAINQFLNSIRHLGHDPVYPFPYGWEVEIPSYITFAEPVIACTLMAKMIWPKRLTGFFVFLYED